VAIDEIRVRRDVEVGDSFRFECERCGQTVQKRAVGRVADMLLAAGAALEPQPPPLSLDDLADLRADLDQDDWLQRLLA
jgi:hypothetical protein